MESVSQYTIIEDGCKIGKRVVIGHHCLIKKGTVIEDDVFFDSYCISSGNNIIGAGSKIRYQSIVARNVVIGKRVFFCAGVKTAYLNHERRENDKPLVIEDDVFVGDNSTILSGLVIAKGSVIGAHSLVTNHLLTPFAVYTGCPAKEIRLLTEGEKDAIYKNSKL